VTSIERNKPRMKRVNTRERERERERKGEGEKVLESVNLKIVR
jgi:hypothetical protein